MIRRAGYSARKLCFLLLGVPSVVCVAGRRVPQPLPSSPGGAERSPHHFEWGLVLDGVEAEVPAAVDFYADASGRWFEQTNIPSDKAYGSFTVLSDAAEKNLKSVIAECSENAIDLVSDENWKIFILHRACMGSAAADRLGVTQYSGHVCPPGLGLPDRQYYVSDKPEDRALVRNYQQHLLHSMTLAGVDAAALGAVTLVRLERELAHKHWTQVACRNRDTTYNKQTQAELKALAPMVTLEALFASALAGTYRSKELLRDL